MTLLLKKKLKSEKKINGLNKLINIWIKASRYIYKLIFIYLYELILAKIFPVVFCFIYSRFIFDSKKFPLIKKNFLSQNI